MKEFLMKVKSCCDNLASCGEVISEHEHVTAILNRLSSEYESVISIVTASQVPYTVQGVTSMLLDTETRQQVINCDISSSENVVSHQSSETYVDNGSIPAYRPSSASRGCGRGRSSNSRIQCQLCGKAGHLVDRCYYRFDSSYKSWCFPNLPPSIWPNSFAGSTPSQVNMPTSGIAQPQAYVATPETVADNSW
ncbi:hypothetical protein Gotri_026889, partial [Gossypium trilobum]|nr:hypothetical protein [Gossypium trilobum]